MKTQIDFRAWHPKFGEMVYSNMNNEYQDKREWYPVCFEIGFSHYPHTIQDNETELMQFTGFCDFQGKKIYVGDVLSIKWKCEVFQNIDGTFMVRFHTNPKGNHPLSVNQFLTKRTIAGAADEDNIIIGNIFENPELLEAVA